MSFDDYTIQSERRRSGSHVEYLARDRRTGRNVALQVMPSSWHGDFTRSLMQRLEALALLDHRNILPVLEAGACESGGYLTRPLVEREPLSERLLDGPAEPQQAAAWACQLADAVIHAHEHGIFGLDLVTDRVRIGPGDEALLTSLDNAHVRFLTPPVPRDPQDGAIMGIPACMPPEQISLKARPDDPRGDVWAMGIFLFHLLTGRHPFPFTGAVETLLAILEEEVPRPRTFNPAIPADLETITLGCLKKNPNDRYASMQQVAEMLSAFREGRPLSQQPLSLMGRVGRWMRGWWGQTQPV